MLFLRRVAAMERDNERDPACAGNRQCECATPAEMCVNHPRAQCFEIRSPGKEPELLEQRAIKRAQSAASPKYHRLCA
jgi:hypothetical protein